MMGTWQELEQSQKAGFLEKWFWRAPILLRGLTRIHVSKIVCRGGLAGGN
jgi:hypothetical protein